MIETEEKRREIEKIERIERSGVSAQRQPQSR
jgi:hypothetical protein